MPRKIYTSCGKCNATSEGIKYSNDKYSTKTYLNIKPTKIYNIDRMQNLAKYTCVKSQVGGEDRDDQNLHTVRTFQIEEQLF